MNLVLFSIVYCASAMTPIRLDGEIAVNSWFTRIQADAEELVRGLNSPEKYEEAVEQLKLFPFYDLPDPISLAFDMLSHIQTTGRGLSVFRNCIYAIVKNNIRKIRSARLTELIEKIEAVTVESQDLDIIAELDLCVSILNLISENQDFADKINENLHKDVIKKPSITMISLILQIYSKFEVYWRKLWFPLCIKVEEIYEQINTREPGLEALKKLSEFKKFVFNNYMDVDWRVISLFCRRMSEIINNNKSEDIRDTAYWTGMGGGQTIKITAFANPSNWINPTRQNMLDSSGRSLIVKFLMSLTTNQDEAIAQDAEKHLLLYQKIEKNPKIKRLYEEFFSKEKTIIEKGGKASPERVSEKISAATLVEYLGCVKSMPLSVMLFVKDHLDNSVRFEDYVEIKNDRCFVKNGLIFDMLSDTEKNGIRHDLLLFLNKIFQFYPKKPKTWPQFRIFVAFMHDFLKNFTTIHPDILKDIVNKLKKFYTTTRSKDGWEKIQGYENILQKYELKSKEQYLSNLKPKELMFTLKPSDYGDRFERWKEEKGFESISIESYSYNKEGEADFIFSVKSVDKNLTKFRSCQKKKTVEIEVIEGASDEYNLLIQKTLSSSFVNAFARVQDSINSGLQKNGIDLKDAALIVDFFEQLLIEKELYFQSVILSSVYFVSLFSFTHYKGLWGLSTNQELCQILDMKLCLSYLYQVYGKKHAENIYLQYVQEFRPQDSPLLIPRKTFLSQKTALKRLLSNFYNAVCCNEKNFKNRNASDLYSRIINNLEEFERPKTVLYECSLAFQKALLNSPSQCPFSINRASIYLRTLETHLNKMRIVDLEKLINTIVQRSYINFGNDKEDSYLQMIQSFNTLMSYIHTIEEIEADKFLELQKSLHQMIRVANHIGPKKELRISVENFVKIYVNLYTFAHYQKKPWHMFEKNLSRKLEELNLNNPNLSLFPIKTLMDGITKFYILHGEYSPVLLRQLTGLFEKISPDCKYNRNFLMKLAKELFPISTILFNSPLSEHFFKVIDLILEDCRKHDQEKGLDYIVDILKIIILIKNNINFLESTPRILEIKKELNAFYSRNITNLIETYVVPLWSESQDNHQTRQLRILLKELSLDLKEDVFFLEKIEDYYQKFLFSNEKNKWTLDSIMSDMAHRFNHSLNYKRLRSSLMKTYDSKGCLIEARNGSNVLEFILGMPCSAPYLKISGEKHNFLSALITPTDIDGIPYTAGFGSGGKMKIRLNSHGLPENSLLPVIPTKELIEGKFGKILEIMTFKEAQYYWSRLFNPAGGDVLSGMFTVMYADDGKVSFGPITNADGTGFIKESAIGLLSKDLERRAPYSLRKPVQTYQAIHHNKKSLDPEFFDRAVLESAKDACTEMDRYLASRQKNQVSLKELYGILTTGCVSPGRNLVAIPASGKDNIIIPIPLKNSDVIIGKTPYETPFNIYPQKENDVSHLKSDDHEKKEAAQFVHSRVGFQYSFIGTTGSSVDFSKGILVVIPDEWWKYPADVVFCQKDKKVSSNWVNSKSRPLDGSTQRYNGVLTVIQKYGPGSFIAVSPDIQMDRWSSDYDGDTITVNMPPKNTETFNFMSETEKKHTPYSTPKIPKTFTSARKSDSSFNIFRFASIVQARTANLLTSYAKMSDIFIALKVSFQQKVSQAVAKIPLIHVLINNILVDQDEKETLEMLEQQPDLIIKKILSAGIKTGADVFKSKVDWGYFKEFEKILTDVYQKLGIPDELIYFKKLCIYMHTTRMNFTKVLLEAQYQSRFFDSFPLHVLNKTLNLFPYYKQKRLSDLLMLQMAMDESAQANMKLLTSNRKEKFFPKRKKISLSKKLGIIPPQAKISMEEEPIQQSEDVYKEEKFLEVAPSPEPVYQEITISEESPTLLSTPDLLEQNLNNLPLDTDVLVEHQGAQFKTQTFDQSIEQIHGEQIIKSIEKDVSKKENFLGAFSPSKPAPQETRISEESPTLVSSELSEQNSNDIPLDNDELAQHQDDRKNQNQSVKSNDYSEFFKFLTENPDSESKSKINTFDPSIEYIHMEQLRKSIEDDVVKRERSVSINWVKAYHGKPEMPKMKMPTNRNFHLHLSGNEVVREILKKTKSSPRSVIKLLRPL